MFRTPLAIALCLALAGTALAQSTTPPATTPAHRTPPAASTPAPAAATAPATAPAPAASSSTHHTRRTLAERFAAANTPHDGKLTLEQARAGRLVAVSRDFAQIDTAKRGYVTLDEIKAFQKKQRADRRAARAAHATPAATQH